MTIPFFYKQRLEQVSKKYDVPLDILSPDPASQWDAENPKHSYNLIKNQIRDSSSKTLELEATGMYKDYLTEQREKQYYYKGQEIKKAEKTIKKQRHSHTIPVHKGKKHYPFTIYLNGKVLSTSPTRSHAVKVKQNFINKIKHYNTTQKDSLMMPDITITGRKGFKKLKF